ncbi:MAG TPA: hypothetical protein VGO63_01045 [Candidatus Paceibacterota bacterium]|jgi:hypothetical protein|nr:hypothetical protein [Candidatus Paceibacterota bacterium]
MDEGAIPQKVKTSIEMGLEAMKLEGLPQPELQNKLALVLEEIKASDEPNWWEKEYEGYNMGENRKQKNAEAEAFLRGLQDEDKTKILAHASENMRYKAHLDWLVTSGMAQKYGTIGIENVVGYVSSQRGLREWLEAKKDKLAGLIETK